MMRWVLLILGLGVCWVEGVPVVPGLGHARHGLDAVAQGRLLIRELRCNVCHVDGANERATGPNLSVVGARVAPDFLQAFIARPSQADPGTQMPHFLDHLQPAKRAEKAEALTHFLISLSPKSFVLGSSTASERDAGGNLFRKIGCVNCHAPTAVGGVGLSHVPRKYGMDSLGAFLFQPLHSRPSGRMPDMNLTRDEARAIAGYLVGNGGSAPAVFKLVAEKVAKGKQYFRQYNCAACHDLPGMAAQRALPLPKLREGQGCLAEKPRGVPDFHLTDQQRKVIGQALAGIHQPLDDRARIAQTMTAFNCIACHTRDDAGGVSNEMFKHFGTDEEGLGNPARIPPTLDGVGVKLRPEWFRKVLFDAETVRPYMHTRMPQFGEANLRDLPTLLEKVDRMPQIALPEPKRDDRRKFREAGHLLVGDKGLNCVVCHNFNGKPSPSLRGLDLLISFERLQPSWFAHFMLDPQKYRPGIVMPNFWPGGEAVRKDVLEGSVDEQLRALWHYFSLGRSARDPSGIRTEGTDLVVTDRARVYRGRSRMAGYRGIAVGFPGGMNYAFNAQNGTLSAFWQGEFVSVYWGGQGAGNFNPRERLVEQSQDVSFFRLPNDKAPWPLRPKMDKENPVNPDPLYPRNRGYQFGGYQLDPRGVPTFLYRTGEVQVEDRSQPVAPDRLNGLVRTLRVEAPKAEAIWFRALTGKVRQVSPGQFRTDGLKLWQPKNASAVLRGEGEEMELLLKLNLPKGKSEWVIRYELL
jgi:mono/diheme cytochrome c family protein